MRNKLRRALALVAAAAVLAGCTTQEPGEPAPDPGPDSASSTTSAPTTTRSSRPQEIKLDGVDPCKVLTADQMEQLSVVEAEAQEQDLSGVGTYPLCDYATVSAPLYGYGVGLVTSAGVEHWQGNGNVDVERTEVAGYPAVRLVLSGTGTVMCSVGVDVADGQHLLVDFNPVGDDYSQEEMCQNAKKAAELALVTLPTLA